MFFFLLFTSVAWTVSPCSIYPNTIVLLGRPRHSQSITENRVFSKATLHFTKQRRPCLETLLLRHPLSPLRLLLLCSISVPFSDRAMAGSVCLNSSQDSHCTGSNLDSCSVTSRELTLSSEVYPYWRFPCQCHDTDREFELLPTPCLTDSRTVRDARQPPLLCIEPCVFEPCRGRSCVKGPSKYLQMLPSQSDGQAGVRADPQILASFWGFGLALSSGW